MPKNNDDLFLDFVLPKPLTKEELIIEFKKCRDGDEIAKEKIATHNVKLVINQVKKKFSNTQYDADELVSVGLFGLVKAIDTFDVEKGFEFTTYATRCIDNEIFMHMRKGNKYLDDASLNETIGTDDNGKDLTLEDTLYDDEYDVTSFYEKEELYRAIRMIIDELPEKEKQAIMMYFGFIDDKKHTQKEIAVKLNCTQSCAARIIKRALEKIKLKLQKSKFIEEKSGDDTKKFETLVLNCENAAFKDEMFSEAKEETNVCTEKNASLTIEIEEEEIDDKKIDVVNEVKDVICKREKDNLEIKLIGDNILFEIIKRLPLKEEVIAYLCFRKVKDKYINPDVVAEFLEMETAEVIAIMMKVLSIYKDEVSQCIDNTILSLEVDAKKLKRKK